MTEPAKKIQVMERTTDRQDEAGSQDQGRKQPAWSTPRMRSIDLLPRLLWGGGSKDNDGTNPSRQGEGGGFSW